MADYKQAWQITVVACNLCNAQTRVPSNRLKSNKQKKL